MLQGRWHRRLDLCLHAGVLVPSRMRWRSHSRSTRLCSSDSVSYSLSYAKPYFLSYSFTHNVPNSVPHSCPNFLPHSCADDLPNTQGCKLSAGAMDTLECKFMQHYLQRGSCCAWTRWVDTSIHWPGRLPDSH